MAVLWQYKLSSNSSADYLGLTVPESEKTRIAKIKDKRSSLLSLFGYFLIKKLGLLYSKDCDIVITRNSFNKPFLNIDTQSLDWFNISHDKDLVVLAADINSKYVGIDVMYTEIPHNMTFLDFLNSLKPAFTSSEVAWIADSVDNLFKLWCLKESYLKATGIGLSVELKYIEFHISENDILLFVKGIKQENWSFKLFSFDGYICSVATSPPNRNIPDCFEEVVSFV
jgi:4'-phosphopantetheinyl transferase